MRISVFGAASIAAIALVACAKKDDAKAIDAAAVETAAVESLESPEALDAAAEAADVYAAPTSLDFSAIRTKDALTAAADTAFAQADADANGTLTQTEFYSLAALLTPTHTVELAPDAAADDASDAVVDAAAGAPAGEAADAIVDEVAVEDPTADTAMLDASFATIAGADANLTTDDLRATFLSRFDAADVDLDGSLDDAEAESFKAAKLF